MSSLDSAKLRAWAQANPGGVVHIGHYGTNDLPPPLEPAPAPAPLPEQQRAEEVLRQQAQAAQAVQESKKALLYTPSGLRGLFPTNLVRPKIVKKAKRAKAQEA